MIKVVHVARDITEQKTSANELRISTELLERSNRELLTKTSELSDAYDTLKSNQMTIMQQEKMASIGQLAAGVAHEINNPIGFVSSNLRTLEKYRINLLNYQDELEKLISRKPTEEERFALLSKKKTLKIDYLRVDSADLIEESLDGTERVRQIVAGLKSFSRVDQAEYSLADLNECLDSTINIVWNELKYKVTLKKEYGEIPSTYCYPQQLNQVFMNLLVNAAHAIDHQGEIQVQTWEEKNYLFVRISDNGCGIEEKHLHRLFEPFFTTKEVGKGTGLGLSIAYEIMQKHEGEIVVESHPGKGTSFELRIPLIEQAAQS